MNYNVYLFSNLIKLFDKDFEELPYDEQYYILPDMYDDFKDSKFNVSSKSEYDCIIDYLNDRYNNISKDIFKCNSCNNTITELDYDYCPICNNKVL